ncbi:hypothetical protein BH10CHL1_BH10CHL1_42200 [soil metagenome]
MHTFAQKQNQAQKPTSSHLARAKRASLGQEQSKASLNGTPSPLIGHDFSQMPIHPPTMPPQTVIQRQPSDGDASKHKSSPKEANQKAELEFHSTITFNDTSSTGPSEEGFAFLSMQWTVWNAGWETAPEHIDRVTMYQADRCSGCRDEKDEILRMEVPAPATVPINQSGAGEFRYTAMTPMVGTNIRAGQYDVYVDLDVYDEVEEINEDNNTIFTSFFVKPSHKSEPDEEGEA